MNVYKLVHHFISPLKGLYNINILINWTSILYSVQLSIYATFKLNIYTYVKKYNFQYEYLSILPWQYFYSTLIFFWGVAIVPLTTHNFHHLLIVMIKNIDRIYLKGFVFIIYLEYLTTRELITGSRGCQYNSQVANDEPNDIFLDSGVQFLMRCEPTIITIPIQ